MMSPHSIFWLLSDGSQIGPSCSVSCPPWRWPEDAMSTVFSLYGLVLLSVRWQIVTLWSGAGCVASAADGASSAAPSSPPTDSQPMSLNLFIWSPAL